MTSRYRSDAGRAAVRAWCERRLDAWTTPHERSEIETSAGRTHLVSAGGGEATVLYLPGTNMNAATSLALAAALAADVRVVVADLPGQPGASTGELPGGDRLRAWGGWAGEVVGAVSAGAPGRLVLVGHSLGGAVALAAPTVGIAGLVLVDPAGLVRLRVPATVLRATVPWLLRPTPERSGALLARMVAPGRPVDPALAGWMTVVARHTRPTTAPGPLPRAVTGRWSGVPRAVLTGEFDRFLPPDLLRPAVRQRLGTDLVELAGAGHLSVDEDPAGVAAAVAAVVRASAS
ncbi:alpha/beta hydrolase [Geodermatophilus sp. YIM 151500]|uniref:alpha/beta fold hydrolase n=1 Tax=Geodermatophilus sp. YIM 151500 TaxID=2984531 RepID=UPI0021E3D8E0|nr:alpha/beta hydrolase [Geodermatophilus sp. YIM 151500]MCV2490555.1 alpha/beta hydrolase [Geodermatophilus sp. YIM 151500]